MRLFGTRAPAPPTETAEQPPSLPSRSMPLRVLRADGQRIDLTSRDTGLMLVATRQQWQSLAWSYRDLIGELRYAQRLLSRSVARVRFYAAQTRPWPEDPAPLDGKDHNLDKQLAADAVHNFERLPMDNNPDGFTARLAENLGVAGEGWVHLDADDRFWVRSTSEIIATPDGQVFISTLPTTTSGSRRLVNPETEDLMRCWCPHPEWGQLADSPMRCLLDTCEDVVLAGREMRAAARSRVAANGVMVLPSTMSLVRSRAEDDDTDDRVVSDTFMADFTAAMLAPIRDDGDPQSVVPIILRGEIEDIKEVRHITLQRADAEQLVKRQEAAIMRLLRGMDVQPEQVQGMGQSNHWSSWIIEAGAIQHQVKPTAETLAACLSQAFLRPALLSLGHGPDAVAQVTIGVDVSDLVENPNRVQDARDAWDREAISDAALREALGFDDDDKPEAPELIRRSLAQGRITPQAIPLIVKTADGVLPDATDIANATGQMMPHPFIVNGEVVPSPALPSGTARPVAAPGQTVPEKPVPNAPSGVVASAALDDMLVDRITVAADAAIARVVERAGAKLRSLSRKDRSLGGVLDGVEAHLVPVTLGRDRAVALVPVPDLLADGYGRLRGQVARWLVDEDRADAVWGELEKTLNAAAERAMFSPPRDGEDALIAAAEVRLALITSARHE